LEKLAVLERAEACGFSLAETRQLLYGFRESSQPSERSRAMARQKMAELNELTTNIAAMSELLRRECVCKDLAECGQRILARKRSTRKT
jgi:DNA-binding transcriptional MerR regulator